jgi:hypothetical protein
MKKGLTVREAATRLRAGKTALYEALAARRNPVSAIGHLDEVERR